VNSRLSGYAWLSVLTAVLTLLLKGEAYRRSQSVGVLSDALESFVNLAAALLALAMLRWAALPPDDDHAFGHEKAEYISAGVEGGLILVAAGGILTSALPRLVHTQPLLDWGMGSGLVALATLANAATATVLLRAGRRHGSIALEADAGHLYSDCLSSLGVLLGVALCAWTGGQILDPLIAIGVAIYVGWTGVSILGRSIHGVLDASLPPEQLEAIERLLDPYRSDGLDFHALRTRRAGRSSFIQLHVLVPGEWSVSKGHDLLEEIEAKLRELVPGARLHTHLEPLDDPASFEDIHLERK